MERCTPMRMSSIFLPLAAHDSTSDSAKTVQVVEIFTGRVAFWAMPPSSPSGISSANEAA